MDILTNALLEKGQIIHNKAQNTLMIHPDDYYSICFMGGITEESLKEAGRYALDRVMYIIECKCFSNTQNP